jgi:hypothetical protein
MMDKQWEEKRKYSQVKYQKSASGCDALLSAFTPFFHFAFVNLLSTHF